MVRDILPYIQILLPYIHQNAVVQKDDTIYIQQQPQENSSKMKEQLNWIICKGLVNGDQHGEQYFRSTSCIIMTKTAACSSRVAQFSAALSALGIQASFIDAFDQPENTLSQRGSIRRSVWAGDLIKPLVCSARCLNGRTHGIFAPDGPGATETEIYALYSTVLVKQRLAVIVGTSTSGIADLESVLP